MPDDRYPEHYILVGRTPIAVDLLTWATWFGKWENRRLWYTIVDEDLRVTVSTIFLGLDHGDSCSGGYTVRRATRSAAIAPMLKPSSDTPKSSQ
jgi:hypothetical protein